MTQSRRAFLATLAAALAAPALAQTDFPMAPDAGFDRWVAKFRSRAANRGISDATLNAAFAQAGFIPEVIRKDR